MNMIPPYTKTQEAMLKILDSVKEIAPTGEREKVAGLIAMPWSDVANYDMRVSKAVLGLCNLVAVCWSGHSYQNGVRDGLKMQSNRPTIKLVDEMAQDPMTEEVAK